MSTTFDVIIVVAWSIFSEERVSRSALRQELHFHPTQSLHLEEILPVGGSLPDHALRHGEQDCWVAICASLVNVSSITPLLGTKCAILRGHGSMYSNTFNHQQTPQCVSGCLPKP